MNPAPSVIVFTVLSGMGFGFMALLAAGVLMPGGWTAFALWGLGYGLSVAGLLASAAHLGNPQRALRAFSQWRSSWLSREAWASVATLVLLAPVALSDWLGLGWPRGIGVVGAVGCALTVLSTAMIYTQIAAVPRWNHWTVPVTFLCFAATGGAILAAPPALAAVLALALGAVLILGWRVGDGLFSARGVTLRSATGLGGIGSVTVFEQPHTGGNYLMREMIYVVGRRHARKLRLIGLVLAALLPALMLLWMPPRFGVPLAAITHLTGALAVRWLFFAQAEHVVGLYYGHHDRSAA